MFYTYFFIFIVLFGFLFLGIQKENFEQPKWEKTLKCLQFVNDDIDVFKEDLLNGKEPNYIINKTIRTARGKGLTDNQVFACLTGDY